MGAHSGGSYVCKLLILKVGERGRNRTFNLLIKSQLLCQLSYAPACMEALQKGKQNYTIGCTPDIHIPFFSPTCPIIGVAIGAIRFAPAGRRPRGVGEVEWSAVLASGPCRTHDVRT